MNSFLNQFSGAGIFQTSSCGSNKAGKLIRWDLTSRCASITETSASLDDCIIFNIYAINVQFVSRKWREIITSNFRAIHYGQTTLVHARSKRTELWLIRALIVFDEAITLQRCTLDCFLCRETNMTVAIGCDISLKKKEGGKKHINMYLLKSPFFYGPVWLSVQVGSVRVLKGKFPGKYQIRNDIQLWLSHYFPQQ